MDARVGLSHLSVQVASLSVARKRQDATSRQWCAPDRGSDADAGSSARPQRADRHLEDPSGGVPTASRTHQLVVPPGPRRPRTAAFAGVPAMLDTPGIGWSNRLSRPRGRTQAGSAPAGCSQSAFMRHASVVRSQQPRQALPYEMLKRCPQPSPNRAVAFSWAGDQPSARATTTPLRSTDSVAGRDEPSPDVWVGVSDIVRNLPAMMSSARWTTR